MYMYWLLGHRIAELNIDERRKETIAMHTFILALDGDINFRPHALHLVVDLMKKNKKLGAACGRIHPIGGGPMVWYQVCPYLC
jgi:chitin synthase